MINITYPENLLYILDKQRSARFIPKRVPNKQKYFKLYHKYFCNDFVTDSYFKVIDSYNIDETNYIELSFSDNIFWVIPNCIVSDTYELIFDKDNILKQKIINSEQSYFGYEIIYWFYHRFNYRYSEFKPYVEDNGKCRLNESCKYFITADFNHGKFTNIKIKLDNRKEF